MLVLRDYPDFFILPCALLLFVAGWLGAALRRRRPDVLPEEDIERLNSVTTSVLGMLALLLGFTFSMAVSRYDLRRDLQLEEAGAISTAWLHTATLPEPQASQSRTLLRSYVDVRLQFYNAGVREGEIAKSLQQTGEIQVKLWSIAASVANTKPDPITTAYINSLDKMIDLTERRTAALEDRIPLVALVLLWFFAVASIFLTGLTLPSPSLMLLWILPIILALGITLVLDLDSPRTGFVRVEQTSMQRLLQQIQTSR